MLRRSRQFRDAGSVLSSAMRSAPLASNANRSGSRAIAVLRVGSDWIISSIGEELAHFSTKAEAVAAAKRSLAKQGGTLTVHQANGMVREFLTLGRDTAIRLNGIEGVALNMVSRRLLREVQSSGLSPPLQLKAIAAAFKK